MIEVQMTDDVRKIDPKVVGRYTKRQIICLLIAATYAVPIAINLPLELVPKLAIGTTLAAPVVLCGWIKVNKEPFEIVAVRYIYKKFLTPQKRKVKILNPYKDALKKVRKDTEKEMVKKMSPQKRKEYEKAKKKGKMVTYSTKKDLKMYR